MAQNSRNAVVVGGSVAGLMAAIVLRAAGYNVTVLERCAEHEFTDRGAGFGLRGEVTTLLDKYRPPSVEIELQPGGEKITDLNRDGSVAGTAPLPRVNSAASWSALVKGMQAIFHEIGPEESNSAFRFASVFSAVEENQDGKLDVRYTLDGQPHAVAAVDLVVGADGANSAVRSQFLKPLTRPYEGYVMYRGLVPMDRLDSNINELVQGALVTNNGDEFSAAFYRISPKEPGAAPRVLWFSYVKCSEDDMTDILRGNDGHQYRQTLPAGKMRPEVYSKFLQMAKEHFAPQLSTLISMSEDAQVQVIMDGASSANTFLSGKVLLVGEAMALVRPHAVAGVKQAAFHALRLADLAEGRISTERWSTDTLAYSTIIMNAGRELAKNYLWNPGVPSLKKGADGSKIMNKMLEDCDAIKDAPDKA